jgi:hypothetical protein
MVQSTYFRDAESVEDFFGFFEEVVQGIIDTHPEMLPPQKYNKDTFLWASSVLSKCGASIPTVFAGGSECYGLFIF